MIRRVSVRYARNPRVLWRSTSRGPVLLAPGHEEAERLGGQAAVVWELLDEPLSASAITELAHAVFPEVDDAASATDELVRLGWVHQQR